MSRPLILVTNDDGIDSPGLAAAAAALEPLGDLLIVAPARQQTSMGRSRSQQGANDGRVAHAIVRSGSRSWEGFGVNATPALTVEYALQALARRPVQLLVSGINYGENVGTCGTVSGTIGAALEGAERGVPSLAVSLETPPSHYFEHDLTTDFRTAMHFVRLFAAGGLSGPWPPDVDVLKIEVPADATPQTGWRVTRQDRLAYFRPVWAEREFCLDEPNSMRYRVAKGQFLREGTDAHALAQGLVSVTPLSLDLTSRVALREVEALFDRPAPAAADAATAAADAGTPPSPES
jgi:5'-nucleotidase